MLLLLWYSSPLSGIQTGVIETTGNSIKYLLFYSLQFHLLTSLHSHYGEIMDHATETKQQNELSEAQVVQEGIKKLVEIARIPLRCLSSFSIGCSHSCSKCTGR